MDVVIDTNVVVSGLLFKGAPGRIVSLWQKKNIRPFVTPEIIEEYFRVLAYPKFQLSSGEIEYLVYQQILPYFEPVSSSTDAQVVIDDPDDAKFIHCALANSIEILISGDKHLLDIVRLESVANLHPSEFLERFDLL